MIAIGMTTAPRPRATAAASLASLRTAGFHQRVILFADGDPGPVVDDNLDVRVNEPALGGLKNFCHALAALVETEAPWLLLLEDDTTWAGGSAKALREDLARIDPESVGYLSLYMHSSVARGLERGRRGLGAGWHECRLGWKSCGSQAYLFPVEGARNLLADGQFQDYRDNWAKNRNRDNVTSKCLQDMGLRRLFRVPALVDHALGAGNSSLRTKPPRNGRYFTGRA